MHDPARASEVTEGRRLGGVRRRREKTIQTAYNFEGFADVREIRRFLEIAAIDTLSLENSVNRSRAMAYIAQVALKTLEVGELENRIKILEETMATSKRGHPS